MEIKHKVNCQTQGRTKIPGKNVENPKEDGAQMMKKNEDT